MRGWELVKAVNFIPSVRICSGVWGRGIVNSFTFLISLKDPSGYNVEKDTKTRAEAEKPLRWYCNSSRQRDGGLHSSAKMGKCTQNMDPQGEKYKSSIMETGRWTLEIT